MQFVKSLIAVAAIAAAVSSVYGIETPMESCDRLDQAMAGDTDLQVDGEKAFAFAKKWLTENCSHFRSKKRALIEAWENIYEPKRCSSSSWKYISDISSCKRPSTLVVLNEPIEAYSKNCLNPDYVGGIVKLRVSKSFNKVDFLDAEFIQKFYEDNPNDIPLHVDWIGDKYWLSRYLSMGKYPILSVGSRYPDPDLNCCRPKRSSGAVNDAIKRNLAKKGKDATGEFHQKPAAMSKYLEKNLFEPCELVVQSYISLAANIGQVTKFYPGGQKALIASLDQETKDVLFRYKYCQVLWLDKDLVLAEAQKMFVE